LAYAGRFELDGADVLHHVELSLFPDWVGKTQRRHIEWRGANDLTLTTPEHTTSRGTRVVNRLRWTRI
jgi:hypothetical protein